MTVKMRVDPLQRDIDLIFAEEFSGAAISKKIASVAREELAKGIETNTAVLGRAPSYEQFVDGRKGGDLDSVKPDGRIVFQFDLVREAVIWIDAQLDAHAPVKTGKYQHSRRLFVDGVETAETAPIPFEMSEIMFIPLAEYARPIEKGESRQAPDGVYQVVAAMARSRWGRIAKISLQWRKVTDLPYPQPAIVLTAL